MCSKTDIKLRFWDPKSFVLDIESENVDCFHRDIRTRIKNSDLPSILLRTTPSPLWWWVRLNTVWGMNQEWGMNHTYKHLTQCCVQWNAFMCLIPIQRTKRNCAAGDKMTTAYPCECGIPIVDTTAMSAGLRAWTNEEATSTKTLQWLWGCEVAVLVYKKAC